MTIGLIITAAGTSSRFGGKTGKLFSSLNHEPVLKKTITCFLNKKIEHCIIPTLKDKIKQVEDIVASLDIPFEVTVIEGGETRKESVFKAFNTLKPVAKVMIHDGARPIVSSELLMRILEASYSYESVIPGLAVTDTIKWVEKGIVKSTVDRTHIMRIQTPQLFTYQLLKKAYENSKDHTICFK